MEDCLFCKIVKGEIPAEKVYEDSEFVAFMDIYPVMKGHTLMIPKFHVEWMQDANDELIAKLFVQVKHLMKKMKENLNCDFVQIGVVGEAVKHLHIHLIPRYLDDNMLRWPILTYNDGEMQDYANKIKG